MKKTILFALLIFLIPSLCPAGSVQDKLKAVLSAGGATVTLTGDIFTESFEGCAADGTSGCDVAWSKSGSPAFNTALAGTPPAAAQAKGLQASSSGSAVYSYHNHGSGVSVFNGRFSLYVDSHSLADTNTVIIANSGTNNAAANSYATILLQLSGTQLKVLANGATASAATNISATTWYTVDYCFTDGAETSNSCGQGNGKGWISLDGGSTKNSFTCSNRSGTNPQQYFFYGVMSASRTVTVTYGQVQQNSTAY